MEQDQKEKDQYLMFQAYRQAQQAEDNGEIPVGGIIVHNDIIIAKAHNQTEQLNDVTAHAEMIAITSAANYLNSKYLHDCTLYITLEPCLMCATALMWSQISRVVYGATDLKRGFNNFEFQALHPKTECEGGILEKKCGLILTEFFKKKR